MDPEISVASQIRQLEEQLLQSDMRASAHELADLLADDFVEFGSSGCVFNKQQTIEDLAVESPVQRSLAEFKASLLAPGVVLATYHVVRHGTSKEADSYSLRSSIWKWIDGRWQIIFHQGTLTRGPELSQAATDKSL